MKLWVRVTVRCVGCGRLMEASEGDHDEDGDFYCFDCFPEIDR